MREERSIAAALARYAVFLSLSVALHLVVILGDRSAADLRALAGPARAAPEARGP